MSAIKTTQIDGDLAIGRNVATGGDMTIQGKEHVKGSLKVDGWLDAPNIKQPCMGLFASAETLAEAYPHPRNGWWALVGDTLPAAVYRAWHGEWVATGETGGEPNVELESIQDDIDNIKAELKKSTVSWFDEVAAKGKLLMMSTNLPRKQIVVAWVESAGRFGAREMKESDLGLQPIDGWEYFMNWVGQDKWCDMNGKPYTDTLYMCGSSAYIANEELTDLVAIEPPGFVAWQEQITKQLNNCATKKQVEPLESLKDDILDTTFMAARDGFATSVDPTEATVPLSFPTVRATDDGFLAEDDEKLTYTIPAATKEHAGVMTAADKQQQEKLSEAVSELQRLVDASTGAIIPDLDIGFSVELI